MPIPTLIQDSVDCFGGGNGSSTVQAAGGTTVYSYSWNNGQTGPILQSVSAGTYSCTITDANGCQRNQYLTVDFVEKMQTFMSNEDVICKDDNSGEARVFIENGTSPYRFVWNTGEEFIDEDNSSIEGLYPGTYSVTVTDTMGCTTSDSITIFTNPKICITVYKVFSPNEDGIHDYWEIENIHLYPEALIEVYDRMGNMVYRRRNYINAEGVAFGGKDVEGQPIPSGTYYYIINLENGDDVFKGTLTIVR